MAAKRMTGAEIIWECLAREGVKNVFGYPGGAILPLYDAIWKYPQIHHVLPRHEQGGTHMADGYARASGKVGVAIATSGPGATNMVTGIATANLDSSPIVCITGQVNSKLIGSDAFQEVDITGVTLPITKHNSVVSRAENIGRAIREAFYIAQSGHKQFGFCFAGYTSSLCDGCTEDRRHYCKQQTKRCIYQSIEK
jgi:acetolactate synthase-1/2/3 large subunit